jgi:hypothetical protein
MAVFGIMIWLDVWVATYIFIAVMVALLLFEAGLLRIFSFAPFVRFRDLITCFQSLATHVFEKVCEEHKLEVENR